MGRVIIEPGAEIVNSVIRGPAIIGEKSRIVDAYVGPFTSIYHGVEIRKSEVEYSIVLEDSKLLDLPTRIDHSLIGKDVVIQRTAVLPKALRFMLGDQSRVELTP
jgi:glucose-1-phosphate thymidylyltransferase